ncbi:MAG: thiosulfate oxidation carrier protein SoxY, partial [Burkholderiales bacterium]
MAMSSIFINRRRALRVLARLGGALAALGTISPLLAATWNKKAFEAMKIEEAIKNAGISNAQLSDQIAINAPEIAENGAQVPMDVTSMIPNTERIFIFSDKNVQPYVANFAISKFVDPF